MKLFVPLYARILGWFFLNVLVIALILGVFLGARFRAGLDMLVAGDAGGRVMALGRVIFAELRDRKPEDWTAVLDRFGEAYGVTFYLFRPDGGQIAGNGVTLPGDVRAVLDDGRPPDGPGRPPGPDAGPPPARPPVSLVHSRNPDFFWLIVRAAGPAPSPGRRHEAPMILLLRSETLSAGGLIVDWMPWVAAAAGALVLSFVFWLLPVRSITRTIAAITAATSRIARGRFDVRVPDTRRDELGELAASINDMAARLSEYVGGQKRFMADVAHELCAPLSRLQMALGVLEAREAGSRSGLADLRDEVETLSGLVNEMLAFSKASLAAGSVELSSVSLRAAAERAAQREIAGKMPVEITVPVQLHGLANPDLLLRALGNLLRNALRHAGPACRVTITGARENGDAVLSVRDDGPGVAPEALRRIFEPFYRSDASRTRETGGVGLGLSIVKTCIETCGGDVSCRNLDPHGFEVSLRLAAGPDAPAGEAETGEGSR